MTVYDSSERIILRFPTMIQFRNELLIINPYIE